jgi:hypothetical protein
MAAIPDPVTDPTDVRSLVPRVRRALDSAGNTTVLTDDEVVALTADAIAAVIFYTGGQSLAFGYQLIVTERDEVYLAPIAWKTDTELTPEAQTVVAAQAALDRLFTRLSEIKVSETLRDEGQEWSYQLSASMLTKQIDVLVKMRDDALARVAAQNAMYDRYVTYLAGWDEQLLELVALRYIPNLALGV